MTPEQSTPRPRRLGLVLGLLGGGLVVLALLVVGAVLVVQALDRQAAADDHAAASEQVSAAVAASEVLLDESAEVLVLAADPLVPADPTAELADEADRVADVVSDAGDLLGEPIDELGTDDIRDLTAALRDAATDVTVATGSLAAELDALMLATRDAAPAFDDAHFEAENAPRIAFRDAAAELEWAFDEQTAEVLGAYLDAGRALVASHEEELAEKAGPLFDLRMAVQAYARSIDGGVMLEFDWAPLVNGYGENGSYGGTSYWVSDHGGYATITLSDSVARMWPGAGVMALVTHEVGHAILSRPDCYQSYFGSEHDLGNEESWATAWAIGMGQTADGSGESIYGRPTDALIALSQQCR